MAEAHGKELRKLAEGGKVDQGLEVLRKAKIALTELNYLPPNQEKSKTSAKERKIARDVYESAVLLSVAAQDISMLERHLLLLRPFNFDYRDELGDSKQRSEMIALELLTLLVDSRLAEFHSLLELVPMNERQNKYTMFVVELEQYLMEGSYNKVLAARKRTPSKTYSWLLEVLEETVREEIASCIEAAYPSIKLSSAQKLMNLPSSKALEEFCASKESWSVEGNMIKFKGEELGDLADQIPSHQLITENLNYAHELERIV
mmetsp:Transcript_2456/g.4068  ORF Transcript_2456/g.4068 Transcript_2456/m.4068 type:complete len:261 (+) Transcript_2456:126-908(+)|eukprot:CAMPEP_0184523498 /NCGR_PEP_ID=MMETSP0198_2-20121128/8920_1 /TAXON_ID=1112570 /ORGANISM="Thraustochytrium sp., Strain LLF1b" /LENGTH=260 /DNA_ID=CAMNT_0026914541 /DNA_START=129 /DNA_END=911 /DNA_ORIENTATION=+